MIRVTRSAIIDAPIERVWAILRDFNSHTAWHPVVADSSIENDEPSDQVGCVRNFTLKDGNHIREQLLALSDTDYVSTYCILDATLPLRRYVATVQLKRVTDGDRTFWHWQSTFDAPRGREQEFADLVGKGVYEGGFDGLRAFLRRRPGAATTGAAATVRSPVGDALATQGVVVSRFGGPETLEVRALTAPAPGRGEVRIRHTAIGVNYIDVYVRTGEYRMIDPPAPPGMEAAGEILDIGEGVTHLLPGDRVAYACPPPGAYVGVRTLPARHVVVLPDEVDDETAAALMLKGMTAEYLLHRTHAVRAGETLLVHAAAGGVGLLLCQWAKALGARVIGTVSTEDKARAARAAGCDAVIVGRDYAFAAAVHDATAGRGADVIFDGLGRAAAQENLATLAMRGHWICYGHATGAIEQLSLGAIGEKSATISSPVLFHYTDDPATLAEMANRTFDALRRGVIRLDVRHRYPLAAAAEAHRDLEGRRTIGPLVLLP
jgi:NADPH:quinone reductase-like Zn-dependent oxidoreductase